MLRYAAVLAVLVPTLARAEPGPRFAIGLDQTLGHGGHVEALDLGMRVESGLFLRVNRRLALAPAGERLLQSARRVLDELKLVEEDIGRLASHQDGVIRVSTECYTCYQWLPPLLKPFHKTFPRVDVEIVQDVTRRTLEALHERKIDLALV